MKNDEPLDSVMRYHSRECITEYHLKKWENQEMGELEADHFTYHLDECEKCGKMLDDLLKQRQGIPVNCRSTSPSLAQPLRAAGLATFRWVRSLFSSIAATPRRGGLLV